MPQVSEELVSMHHLLSFSVILIRYRYGGFFAPDVVWLFSQLGKKRQKVPFRKDVVL